MEKVEFFRIVLLTIAFCIVFKFVWLGVLFDIYLKVSGFFVFLLFEVPTMPFFKKGGGLIVAACLVVIAMII